MRKLCSILFVLLLSSCNLPLQGVTSPSATNTPTAVIPAALTCKDETCLMDGMQFDYLIVTRPKFIEALAAFIDWKTENGFRLGLVTVEWLEANYSGRHLAEKMKNGMHDLRRRAGVKYVLLVGDTQMKKDDFTVQNVLASYDLSEDFNVPTGFYRRLSADPRDDVLPSDAYFVEDRDWDPENTGLNPRPDNMETGEGTLQADLYIGRWSVREPEEIAVLFEKTRQAGIATQIFFSSDVTLSDGVNTGCSAWPPAPNDSFGCYLDPMVIGRTQFFEANAPHITTDSIFVDQNDSQQVSAFMKKFRASQGVTVALYHGSYTCWKIRQNCISAGRIQFEYVFPLLETEACLVSAFYAGEVSTVTESLSVYPTGPAVITQAPNPVLFLRDLRDGKSVGEAFWATASTYLYWPNPIILLGDPSLIVFRGP